LGEAEIADDDLLIEIGKGNRRAFRVLMLRHAPAMLALAQRITRNAGDADEIVQETFLKLWTSPDRWQPGGRGLFSTWLYRVVLNACLDRRRRRVPEPLDSAPEAADESPDGLRLAISAECRRVVEESLEELPVRQREAMSLHYFGEVSAVQAAQILGLSLSSVESLLVRGRRALRDSLMRRGIVRMGDVI
jgi:RNA polymerase sigma-70 factor (ECF subfamily)